MTSLGLRHKADSCATLLARLQRVTPVSCQKLAFDGIARRDVYNITAPFELDGRRIIAGRVEDRNVELSEIVFFAEDRSVWRPVPCAVTFPGLQDPCVTFIGATLVLGGVRFPVPLADGTQGWRMEFYRGTSLNNLELFLIGPERMKDIRLVELADGRIAVLTRPQGEKGGRGQIGYFAASSLESISAAAIEAAPVFAHQCRADEWVGANEAHLLRNGKLGVLGHIACFDRHEHRHYYPMVFFIDPATGTSTQPEIIASRAEFPPGAAKRPDLVDVMFSGGLVRHEDETATLYAGLSDAEAGCARLPDPFVHCERDFSSIFLPESVTDFGSAAAIAAPLRS